MYSPRPVSALGTGRPSCGRTSLDPHDCVGHLDRLQQHALDRGEQQLIQVRKHFVHGEGLSTTPPSSRAIFGRPQLPSHEDRQSPCAHNHTKWTRAETSQQKPAYPLGPRPARHRRTRRPGSPPSPYLRPPQRLQPVRGHPAREGGDEFFRPQKYQLRLGSHKAPCRRRGTRPCDALEVSPPPTERYADAAVGRLVEPVPHCHQPDSVRRGDLVRRLGGKITCSSMRSSGTGGEGSRRTHTQ